MLLGESRNISPSSLDSAVFTLDPKDKYLPPGVRRATTTSAVHARKARLPATSRSFVRASRNGSTGAEGAPQTSKKIKTVLTLERQRSLLSIFHRMRQTRSAPSNTKSSLVWPRKIFSRAGQPTKQDTSDCVREVAELPNRSPSLPTTRMGAEFELPVQSPSTTGSTVRAPTALLVNLTGPKHNVHPLEQLTSSDYSQSALPNEREQELKDEPVTSSVRNSETSFLSSYYTPLEQLGDNHSNFATPLSDHFDRLNLAPNAGETSTEPTKMPLEEQTTISNAVPSTEMPGLLELDFRSPKYGYAESLASYATSANFSPCLASNTTHSGPMSPCRLSPETPVTSEFGDDFLPPVRDSESLTQMGRRTSGDLEHLLVNSPSRPAPPISKPQGGDGQSSHATPLGGFQGYSLPDHDHASALTIRKLPSITLKKRDCASPFTQQSSKQDLVHSWNDGSEHRVTALEELVDDLGYLGKLII